MNKYKFLKSVITIILMNSILVGGWIFSYSYIKGLKEEVVETRSEIFTNENRINNVYSLERLFSDFSRERDVLNEAVLTGNNLVDFIEFLEDLAQKSDVELSISSASFPQKGGENTSSADSSGGLSFQIKTYGSFANLIKYSALLESTPFQISFQDARIQKLDESQQNVFETDKDWQGIFNISVLSYL